jgi:hypothetical protein
MPDSETAFAHSFRAYVNASVIAPGCDRQLLTPNVLQLSPLAEAIRTFIFHLTSAMLAA